MTSQREPFVELMYYKCELLLYSSFIPAQKCSHTVTSTMPKRWVAAVTREVIAIDGFRVASTTKRSSKKSQRDCAHSSDKCLPDIQQKFEWHHFLDGCPQERPFPVAIATNRSSRTDSSGLAATGGVCIERSSDTHWRPHF